MSNTWFRFYSGAVNDPKVQRLDPRLFKVWVNILCVASENDGKIPELADLAFILRVEESVLSADFDALVATGLIDEFEEFATPHNWARRQFQSDSSTPRVKRFRDKTRNVSAAVSETPPDTDTDTDTDQNREGVSLPTEARPSAEPDQASEAVPTEARPSAEPDQASEAVEIYNTAAAETQWPTVQRLTPQRRAAVNARLRECGGIPGWQAAIDKGKASSFLCGGNGDGWRADFDFICRSKSFTKIMEGSYDDRKPTGKGAGRTSSAADAVLRLMATKIAPGFGDDRQPPGSDDGDGADRGGEGADPSPHIDLEATDYRRAG